MEAGTKTKIRKRTQSALRRQPLALHTIYLVALFALVILGGVFRVAYLGNHVWMELLRCLVPIGIALGALYLLRRFPIMSVLREQAGLAIILLCFALGMFSMLNEFRDPDARITTWPVFSLVSILIISAAGYAAERYCSCTAPFVVGSASVIAMLSLLLGDSFNATLALLLALVIGIVAVFHDTTGPKDVDYSDLAILILSWAVTVLALFSISDDFFSDTVLDFVNYLTYPLDPRDVSKHFDILRSCRFLGHSAAADVLQQKDSNLLLLAATELGWGVFALLLLVLVGVIVLAALSLRKKKSLELFLGVGSTVVLILLFLGEPLQAFAIRSPFLYSIPLFSGNVYYTISTLLIAILIFNLEPKPACSCQDSFLRCEMDRIHHHLVPGLDPDASAVAMRTVLLPEWEAALQEMFDHPKERIVLKKMNLLKWMLEKEHGTICRYYGPLFELPDAFERVCLRGDYTAVKIVANRNADPEDLILAACHLSTTTVAQDSDMCIGIDDTLEDDKISVYLLVL